MPVFLIHGNHDGNIGQFFISICDILASTY